MGLAEFLKNATLGSLLLFGGQTIFHRLMLLLVPGINDEIVSSAAFRKEDDPLRMYTIFYPFLLAVSLAFLYTLFKKSLPSNPMDRAATFALGIFGLAVPNFGLLFVTFDVSLHLVLYWVLSFFIQLFTFVTIVCLAEPAHTHAETKKKGAEEANVQPKEKQREKVNEKKQKQKQSPQQQQPKKKQNSATTATQTAPERTSKQQKNNNQTELEATTSVNRQEVTGRATSEEASGYQKKKKRGKKSGSGSQSEDVSSTTPQTPLEESQSPEDEDVDGGFITVVAKKGKKKKQ